MSDGALGTCLNDHLAGAVGAVKMVEPAIRENEGNPTCSEPPGSAD